MLLTMEIAATTVDDLCKAAGATKGTCFHHFKSKEQPAIAAAGFFSQMADGIFATPTPSRPVASASGKS